MKIEEVRRCLKTLSNVANELSFPIDKSFEHHQIEVLAGIMVKLHESNKQQVELNSKLVSALEGIKKELDYIGRAIQEK